MAPEKVCILTGACATLQNVAILRNEPMDGLDNTEDQPQLAKYYNPEDGKVIRNYNYM